MLKMTQYMASIALACSCQLASSTLLATDIPSIQLPVGTGSFTLYHKGYIQPSYDEHSKLNKITYFDTDTRAYASQMWSYNSLGKVEKKQYREDLTRFFAATNFQYSYNAQQLIFEEKENSRGACQRVIQYQYSPMGNLECIASYQGPSSKTSEESVLIDYTPEGLFDKCTIYDKFANVALHYQWRYDAMGRVVAKCTYDQNLQLLGYTYIEYDFDTNQDLEIVFDAHERPVTNTLVLKDAQGHVLERGVYDAEGAWLEATLYNYNESGKIDLIRDLAKDEEGAPVIIGYIATSFDEEGRVELTSYQYLDIDRLVKPILPYLQLPGNDLITPPWELIKE